MNNDEVWWNENLAKNEVVGMNAELPKSKLLLKVFISASVDEW